MTLSFDVAGQPVPQGDLTSSSRARLFHANARSLRPWRMAIAEEARDAMPGDELLTTPIALRLEFRIPRPQSHYTAKGLRRPSAPDFPAGHVGDVDKLSRAALDAMTVVVFADDCQVVELRVRKVYCDRWVQPGVSIDVRECLL
jgi:Holliday junction resolvase RusA-like endonuclease